MSEALPPPLSLAVIAPTAGPAPGSVEPAFTITGPASLGVAATLLPDGFAPPGAAPVFTITGPGNEARMRALEQRCEELQRQIARLARS